MNKKFPKIPFLSIRKGKNINRAFSLIFTAFLTLAIGTLIVSYPTARVAGEQVFNTFQSVQISKQNIWQKTDRSSLSALADGIPAEFQALRLNKKALSSILQSAPHESRLPLGKSDVVLPLPLPDGLFADFRIQEAPVLEPAMAERFPEIKSYRAVGIDDPTMTARFDLTPQGFHAVIIVNGEAINILPADTNNPDLYASFNSLDSEQIEKACTAVEEHLKREGADFLTAPQIAVGDTLRTYKIAIATTWEYANALGGGTNSGTVASINTWLNGINAIYERELSVRLILVNNTNILYTTERGFTAATDPFTDTNQNTMLNEVRTVLRDQVGAANYNLGHVLALNAGGGVAYMGVICNDGNNGADTFGPLKGGGVSPMNAPVGNSGSIKLFAHELGHQFGAGHTFNGTTGSCSGGNRSASTAYEPGSGSTIMSYASICGTDNITNSVSDLRFHAGSFSQITNHIINQNGSSCATTSATGNNAPTVTVTTSYNIPKNTPFALTATGGDPNTGDANNLTYVWEQYDAGGTFSNPPYNDSADAANTTRPIFRAFAPTTNSTRTFPSLNYILNNANDPPDILGGFQTAEELPRIGRTLNFRVTARDNLGGVNDASTVLNVDGNSGPFNVTAPNSTVAWTGNSSQTVTWNVANTANAPVNAANVKISLSADGGNTFPITLAASVPNDGAQSVTIPNGINTTTARIKVEAVGNVFFDISDTNFSIAPGDSCPIISDFSPKVATVGGAVIITGTNFTDVTAVKFSNNVNATFIVNSNTQITATVPNGAVGGPITLTKPGCGDAQTSNFTVCPGAAATIQVDDGTVESATKAGVTGQPSYYVNRLTPTSYPATLSQVSIEFPSFAGLTAGTPVTILAGANPSGAASIDNISLQTVAASVTNLDTFVSYNVSPITINSGDFVVGFSIVNQDGVFAAGVDTDTKQNRSYQSGSGTSFSNLADGNLLIRAQAFTGTCTDGACSYSITPTNQEISGNGGTGLITVTASSANCPWTAVRNNTWISLTSSANNTGSGTLGFSVAPNSTGSSRTGSITLAGKTFTVTQGTASLLSISGAVTYAHPSANQTARSVTGVTLTATGTPQVQSAPTDGSGNYQLTGFGAGTYTVTPTKTTHINGITAFDATLVLRCVAAGGNCTLTANQKKAGDSDNDGGITAFDATQILRFVAANGSNANTGNAGKWKFDPENRPYSNLTNNSTGQNYTAFLIGEVDGDWAP
ncbi:MAG: M12 family metallo-peptidase [Acidobacteriota bacterium]|nr:M12 family metallo-peptidase [Acidobacteriota bacterium]